MEDSRAPTLEDVRQALLCLYEPRELSRCRLFQVLGGPGGDAEARGQGLRRLILDAMEQLRPRGRAAPSASEYRAYDCVTLRYVSSLSVEEIAEELSLSRRQVYRDLRWGENRLAELLEARRQMREDEAAPAADALTQEIEALPRRQEAVSLVEVVQGAISALAPLVARFEVTLSYSGPNGGVAVMATPGVLREAIVQALSAVVQCSRGDAVAVTLTTDRGEALLNLPALPTGSPQSGLLRGALRILEAQGVTCGPAREGEGRLLLRLPLARRYRVLLVEDNPSAIALYERYLEGSEWEPVLLPNGRVAEEIAASRRAHAVILDIMMPETDGWSVLQALKLDPRTRDIPVIVCSVVDDPELGRALGATAYLTKPVARPALLEALAAARQGRSPAAVDPGRRG